MDNMINRIQRAMSDPDHWVVEIKYRDAKGNLTQRTVSPIRFLTGERILALCLSRQEPRQFYINRCENVELKLASDVLITAFA